MYEQLVHEVKRLFRQFQITKSWRISPCGQQRHSSYKHKLLSISYMSEFDHRVDEFS